MTKSGQAVPVERGFMEFERGLRMPPKAKDVRRTEKDKVVGLLGGKAVRRFVRLPDGTVIPEPGPTEE